MEIGVELFVVCCCKVKMCGSTINSSNHLHQPTTIHEFHLDVYPEISIYLNLSEVTLYCKRNVVGGYMSVPCVLGLALRPVSCRVCWGWRVYKLKI